MRRESIARFFGIPGHQVAAIHFLDASGRSAQDDRAVERVVIELTRTEKRFTCRCGRAFERYYDCRDLFVRDLPWGPWPTVELLVPRFRLCCPECGVKTEALVWLDARHRQTRRLSDAVALACREVRSIKAIAEAFHLDWQTVKRIDKAALALELNPPDFTGLRHLAIDEFSIRRRHTYGTIFLDVERNRVLWVCATREKEAVKEVFEKVFGPKVCAQIEAVSMDWWEGYESAVSECLPNAEIIWDLFHVVKKYNLEVIDRVRLDESLRYQDRDERLAFKKSKFLLLKNRQNLLSHELARLKDLPRVNRHPGDRVYPPRRDQTVVELPLRRMVQKVVRQLVSPGHALPHSSSPALCARPAGAHPRRARSLPTPHQLRRPRRRQQQGQGNQTRSLRLPRRSLLLSQDQVSLHRSGSTMNHEERLFKLQDSGRPDWGSQTPALQTPAAPCHVGYRHPQ